MNNNNNNTSSNSGIECVKTSSAAVVDMDKGSGQTRTFSCKSVFQWKLIVFIAAIIAWSYYAYVVQFCLFTLADTAEKATLLTVYHIIFVLFIWSYARTIFTPIAKIPAEWHMPTAGDHRIQQQMLENAVRVLPVVTRNRGGSIRFCYTCQVVKPDRVHHCCACGKCVPKMDHHCAWVNNCVHFGNYKYFILFLGYALLYCIFIVSTTLKNFIKFWHHELDDSIAHFHLIALFILCIMFTISLMGLFCYHIYLVLLNRTTLESAFPQEFLNGERDKDGFNLGKFANFKEVFGNNCALWLLPIYTSRGNGLQYPTKKQHHLPTYNSMGVSETVLELAASDHLLESTTHA